MSKTSKLGLGFLDKVKKIKQDYQSNLTSYNEIQKSIEESLNYKKRDVGELKLDTSDFSDSNIQKMIEFYSETMNQSKDEVEQKLKADAQEQLDYLQKAPVMCKNAIENLAAGSAFNMLQSIDLSKIDNKPFETQNKGVNEFNYTLPSTGVNITYKVLTHGDEQKIQTEIDG